MLRVLLLLSVVAISYAELFGRIKEALVRGNFADANISEHPNWSALNGPKCGVGNSDRIINGMVANLRELPWLVRIGYTGPKIIDVSYRCGGALINNNTILTAAHCVTGLPKDVKVAAVQIGEYNAQTDPDCDDKECAPSVQTLKPKEIITHSDYNNQPFKNDIALIRVDNIIIDNVFVTPICVTSGTLLTHDFHNVELKVAGWGIYNISDPKNSDLPMVIFMGVQDTDMCQKEYARHASIGSTQMCVGGTLGKDSCGGDSGGPLMMFSDHESAGAYRQYVVGIVSFGTKRCGETEMPGIYTRLSSYIDWLLDNILRNTVKYRLIQ